MTTSLCKKGFTIAPERATPSRMFAARAVIREHVFVGKGSSNDVRFPKGPPTQFVLTDSTILKSSMAILTYRLG